MACLAFIPGTTGGGEMLVIFLVVLLLFGAEKIPEVARGLARGLHELRKASREVLDEIRSLTEEPPPASSPEAKARPAADEESVDPGTEPPSPRDSGSGLAG